MTDPDVIAMTLAQEGAYRRLLDVCWLESGLPSDPSILWRLAKADSEQVFRAELWPIVCRKFHERDGKLQHGRLDTERTKQRKNSRARKLAARARWDKMQLHGDANAIQPASLSSAIAIATAVRTKTPPNPPPSGGRRLTAGELDKARKHIASIGGCPHGLTHSVGECAKLIALSWRGEKVSA
jgi:uncharacterized protein YdaU (DUF1376 family)